MFGDVITLFNYHKGAGLWYPKVIPNADFNLTRSTDHTTQGYNSETAAQFLVPCKKDRTVFTTAGVKEYLPPKAFAKCEKPEGYFTFAPECDFIYVGNWSDLSAIPDDDYESGLYHEMNDEKDGVYMIASAAFYSLIPHFEIDGR